MISSIDIVLSILRGENNFSMLALTVVYFILVIVFQIITLLSTRKLIAKSDDARGVSENGSSKRIETFRSPELSLAAGSNDFVAPSVVERTTELIDRPESLTVDYAKTRAK